MKKESLCINNIYNEYYRGIFSLINKSIRNKELTKELTNDVFLKVDKHIDNYDPKLGKLSTWIFNIAKNIIIDAIRNVSIRNNNSNYSIDNPDFENSFETNTTPYKVLLNKERVERINKSMQKLPKIQRRVFNFYFNHDMKLKEIAEKLNVPIGTVKGNIHRSRETLKVKLIHV